MDVYAVKTQREACAAHVVTGCYDHMATHSSPGLHY